MTEKQEKISLDEMRRQWASVWGQDPNLLKGKLFDQDGTPYSPGYTKKKGGNIYRYYISQNLFQYRDHPKGTMARIPAYEIEKTVADAVSAQIIKALALDPVEDHETVIHISGHLPSGVALINAGVSRIIVQNNTLEILMDVAKTRAYLENILRLAIPSSGQNNYMLFVPFLTRRAYKGAIIMKPETDQHDPFDLPPMQLKNLIRGIIWRDEHFSGLSMQEIANREGLSKAGVRKIIMGSFDTLMAI